MASCEGNDFIILLFVTLAFPYCSRANVNQSPKISVGLPYSGKQGVLILSEDTPLNSYLGIMETKDDDMGPAGEVECSTDNPYIRIPLVYPRTFKIELAKQLDRETDSASQVVILCSDNGTPPMTSTAAFNIEVTDINDNAPIFENSTYIISIAEGVDVGTFVVMVTATDSDTRPNGVIQYSFYNATNNVSTCCTIDPVSGQIVTNSEIDRELVSQYILIVVAEDSGLPSLSSTAEVIIHVEDVNDNQPVVLTKDIHVKENIKPMGHVGRIIATDRDIGKNAQLVFSKTENSKYLSSTPFLVESSGDIISAVSLDREQISQYAIQITVRDKGNPRQSSTATVIIIVDDVNDNIPTITSPCLYDDNDFNLENFSPLSNDSNKFSRSVTIDWYSPDDKRIVYQVKAEDNDVGNNSQLRFSIESVSLTSGDTFNTTFIPPKDPLFQINELTGEILLARFIRRHDQFQQFLNISVTDQGTPALTAFCLINITINVDPNQLATPKTIKSKITKVNRRRRKYGNGSQLPGFVGTFSCLLMISVNYITIL